MWVKPSARDKQLIKLRNAARGEGLSVKLVDDAMRRCVSTLDNEGLAESVYWLFFEVPIKVPNNGLCHIKLTKDGLQLINASDYPESFSLLWEKYTNVDISKLPDNQGVLLGKQGIAFIWREKGGEEEVREIAVFLRDIRDQLLAN